MRKCRFIGGMVALIVLCSSVVYYNFIDKAAISGAGKGNRCPDFTAQTYQVENGTFSLSENTFTLSEQIGKICVVNFWETWCQACIEELPSFNEIQKEYGEAIEVIAIAGVTSTLEGAATWMNNQGWKTFDEKSDWATFSLTFAYLPTANCTQLGCGGMLPRTVIVDKSGIIAHEQDGAMTHEALQEIIEGLL